MTIHVSRKLKNTNQRINALEKRVADLEKMLKTALTPPPLCSPGFKEIAEHWELYNAI